MAHYSRHEMLSGSPEASESGREASGGGGGGRGLGAAEIQTGREGSIQRAAGREVRGSKRLKGKEDDSLLG